ncbi:MAG: lactate racemase domain-containing protein [Acidobacteriota bacterium]
MSLDEQPVRTDSGKLSAEAARRIVESFLAPLDLDGRRVLVIVPDRTRTAPIPLMFQLLCRHLAPRVKSLEFLVALGTHPALDATGMNALFGLTPESRAQLPGNVTLHNHHWELPETFVQVGTIPKSTIEEIVGPVIAGLPHDAGLVRDLPVSLNRKVLECDHVIVCGPTFPHEVVGFSGGNKYFFPGISGPEVIHYTHWLGAVVTSYRIIGTRRTPVRAVIDRAAALIDKPKTCLSLVVEGDGLAGLFAGNPEEAFEAAADLSARLHIRYLDRPVQRVLSVMPAMYDDIWTAAKGMYKLEPVVADGGEVILYAPHIDEISYTHGRLLDEIGYHVFEYFFKQWDRFRRYPGGILAHSTHLRGLGTYDAETGIERPRIQVTLATAIPPERCRRVGLGYRAPDSVDVAGWESQGEGYLKVPKAGELLFRLKSFASASSA